jgi:hypothetical protein
MHADRNPMAAATVRKRIQGGLMVGCLQDHALGKKEMTATQVTAALGLLRKVVPDLTATTLSGDPDHPLEHHHVAGLVESKLFQGATDRSSAPELVKLNGNGTGKPVV